MKITITRDTVQRLRTYLDALWGKGVPHGAREHSTFQILWPLGPALTWRQEKRRALIEMLALERVFA